MNYDKLLIEVLLEALTMLIYSNAKSESLYEINTYNARTWKNYISDELKRACNYKKENVTVLELKQMKDIENHILRKALKTVSDRIIDETSKEIEKTSQIIKEKYQGISKTTDKAIEDLKKEGLNKYLK